MFLRWSGTSGLTCAVAGAWPPFSMASVRRSETGLGLLAPLSEEAGLDCCNASRWAISICVA